MPEGGFSFEEARGAQAPAGGFTFDEARTPLKGGFTFDEARSPSPAYWGGEVSRQRTEPSRTPYQPNVAAPSGVAMPSTAQPKIVSPGKPGAPPAPSVVQPSGGFPYSPDLRLPPGSASPTSTVKVPTEREIRTQRAREMVANALREFRESSMRALQEANDRIHGVRPKPPTWGGEVSRMPLVPAADLYDVMPGARAVAAGATGGIQDELRREESAAASDAGMLPDTVRLSDLASGARAAASGATGGIQAQLQEERRQRYLQARGSDRGMLPPISKPDLRFVAPGARAAAGGATGGIEGQILDELRTLKGRLDVIAPQVAEPTQEERNRPFTFQEAQQEARAPRAPAVVSRPGQPVTQLEAQQVREPLPQTGRGQVYPRGATAAPTRPAETPVEPIGGPSMTEPAVSLQDVQRLAKGPLPWAETAPGRAGAVPERPSVIYDQRGAIVNRPLPAPEAPLLEPAAPTGGPRIAVTAPTEPLDVRPRLPGPDMSEALAGLPNRLQGTVSLAKIVDLLKSGGPKVEGRDLSPVPAPSSKRFEPPAARLPLSRTEMTQRLLLGGPLGEQIAPLDVLKSTQEDLKRYEKESKSTDARTIERSQQTLREQKPVKHEKLTQRQKDQAGYDRAIPLAYTRFTNIPTGLIEKVVHQESRGIVDAISGMGARGLMQLMPSTAKQLGVKDPFDPFQNVMGGAKKLSGLITRYNGDVYSALAAYNSGEANIDDYLNGTNRTGNNPKHRITKHGIPVWVETRNYVYKITGERPWLEKP